MSLDKKVGSGFDSSKLVCLICKRYFRCDDLLFGNPSLPK